MIIYVYEKCSTCQKALRFLQENHIPFTQKDIKNHPPTIQELQTMLGYQNHEIKKLFNTSGLLYKEMKLSEKLSSMSLKEALLLMTKNGMLVKRPFVLSEGFGLVGFKEKEWNASLGTVPKLR